MSKSLIKTVFLIDPRWQGHHLTYIKLFTQILLQQNYQVIVLCPKPDEVYKLILDTMPDYIAQLHVDKLIESKSPSINILGMGALYPTFSRWYLTTNAIAKAKKKFKIKPDIVFFSWLDGYLYLGYSALVCRLLYKLVDIFFPYKWCGLLFHTYTAQAKQNPDIYKIIKSRKCYAIAVLNELNSHDLKKLDKKIVVFPDIADDASPDITYDLVQKIIEKADQRKIIGLLGYLEKRKGILNLIEIAQQSIQKPWFFVFAGVLPQNTFSPTEINKILNFADSNPSNCLFHFERIPEESQFNVLVNKCDVLYAVYQDFSSSSNILTKAAIFKRLVLVANGYYMESIVKEFNLGLSVNETEISKQIEALEILIDQDRFYQNSGFPKFEEYQQLHSVNQLNQSIIDLL